jgi:hypothetical protein
MSFLLYVDIYVEYYTDICLGGGGGYLRKIPVGDEEI